MQEQQQLKVEDTNQQALASKISAAKKGYIVDHYAQQFTQYRGKRDIIIHRGYWARVHIVRRLVQTAISHASPIQIVALGSGLQTLWFNLAEEGVDINKFRFVQLDLQSVVKKKIRKINHSKKLKSLFQKLNLLPVATQHQHVFALGQSYTIASCNLANLNQFKNIIQTHKLDTQIPTLFYSQCVLSYIDPDQVDSLLKYISSSFDLSFFFDYQMYNPNDRFGQLMVKNFQKRGCPLIGIYKYPQLKDQLQRFNAAGFKKTQVFTMKDIYYECINKQERIKIEKIQMLDELQEWNLIMGHYFGLLSVTYTQKGQNLNCFKDITKNLVLKI